MNIFQGFKSILDKFKTNVNVNPRAPLDVLAAHYKRIQDSKGQRATKDQMAQLRLINKEIEGLKIEAFYVDKSKKAVLISTVSHFVMSTKGTVLIYTKAGFEGFRSKKEAADSYQEGINKEIADHNKEIVSLRNRIISRKNKIKILEDKLLTD